MLSIPNLLLFVTLGSISIFLVTFLFYGIFLLFFAFRRSNKSSFSDEDYNPTVTIILPSFNEGDFIKKKIKNLINTDYDLDKIEIIIADDSTDETSIDYINTLANKYPVIQLCRSNTRRGYSQSLIDSFEIANGEIIIITDCGSLYNKSTITELVQPLQNEKIGGVTGAANILNKNEISGKSETLYRRIYNFMRESESNADSTFHYHGEASSVKKELLADLEIVPTNQDIAIAFHIRKKGFKVIFNHKAKFYEYTPKTLKDRHKQKYIRATGLIKVIFKNRSSFSPRYGLFGLIIFPAHFSMMLICPLFLAIGGISSFLLLMTTFIESWFISLLVITGFVGSFIIKKELIINIIQLEIVLLLAIWRATTDRNDVIYIDTISSTRR